MGEMIVFAYSIFGCISGLYVTVSVSLSFPHVVDVSALSIFVAFFPLYVMFCMCLLYFSFGSSVRPRILGYFSMGSVMSSIFRLSSVLYLAGSGVNRVVVVLFGFICRLLFFVHV